MSQMYYKPKHASNTQSHRDYRDYPRKADYQQLDENRNYHPRKDQTKVNHTKEFDQERPLTSKDSQRSYHDKYSQSEKEGSHPSERNYENGYNQKKNFNKNQENKGNLNKTYEFEYIKKEEKMHDGSNNENRIHQGKNYYNLNKGQETQNRKKVTFDLSQEKHNNQNSYKKEKDVEVVYYVKKELNNEEKSLPIEEHKNERKKKYDKRNKSSDENMSIIEQENKSEQNVKAEKNRDVQNDKNKDDSIQDKNEKFENSVASLINKKDYPSSSASKPFLGNYSNGNITTSVDGEKDQSCLISDTESTTSKQALSTPNNPQPINPTQNQNEQPRMMYAPGFNGLQMPAIFQTPYIVFPQPNGTSVIQPLYQYPLMNMGPRNSEDEQQRQPFYLVSSHLLPTPENQSRDNSRVQPMPMAQTNSPFSFPQFQPMFLNPLIGNSIPIQTQQSSERDFQKSVLSDTLSKDETLSDRRDD